MDDQESTIKKLQTNKIYPGTDLDERREGAIGPMTDDDGRLSSAEEGKKMKFGNKKFNMDVEKSFGQNYDSTVT
jgi:hypothetical protein